MLLYVQIINILEDDMKKFLLILLTLSLLCLTACGEANTEAASSNTASTDTSTDTSKAESVPTLDIWEGVKGDSIEKPVDTDDETSIKLFKNNECELNFSEGWEPATVNGTEYDCEWRIVTRAYGTYTISGDKINATAKTQQYLAIEVRGNDAEKWKTDFLESVKDSAEYESYKLAIESVCEFPSKDGGSMKLTFTNTKVAFKIAEISRFDENGKIESLIKRNEDGSGTTTEYDENEEIEYVQEFDANNETVKSTKYEDGKVIYSENVESTKDRKVTTRVDGDGNVIRTEEESYIYFDVNKKIASRKLTENGIVTLDYTVEYHDGGVMALEIEKTISDGIERILTTAYDSSGNSYYDKIVSTEKGELIEYRYWHDFGDTDGSILITYIPGLDVYCIWEEFYDDHGYGTRENEIPATEYDPAEWEKDYK